MAGRKLGASAHAALVTRAFHELTEFGQFVRVRRETLSGLSFLGDLILTCNSPQSRNFTFGRHLGEGLTVEEALAATKGTVEGIATAREVLSWRDEYQSKRGGNRRPELPIIDAVSRILDGRLTVDAAIDELASRPLTAEG